MSILSLHRVQLAVWVENQRDNIEMQSTFFNFASYITLNKSRNDFLNCWPTGHKTPL
jgi:hypothetical protein